MSQSQYWYPRCEIVVPKFILCIPGTAELYPISALEAVEKIRDSLESEKRADSDDFFQYQNGPYGQQLRTNFGSGTSNPAVVKD